MSTPANLETFDVLELLFMLAQHGRTGALRVDVPDGAAFWAYLEQGRVRHVECGTLTGGSALAPLIADPRGPFHFIDGLTCPAPSLDMSVEALALEALRELPAPTLTFDGLARLRLPERVEAMLLSLRERDVLREVNSGRPLLELVQDPVARDLLARLARLGLLVPRRTRLARLRVGVTHDFTDTALVDDVILRRWQDDVGRHVARVEIRREHGTILNFPVQGGATAGKHLLLPPDLLLQHDLRAGEMVLVRPF